MRYVCYITMESAKWMLSLYNKISYGINALRNYLYILYNNGWHETIKITSNPVHRFNIFTIPLSSINEFVKSKPPSFSSLKIGCKFFCFLVQNRHKLLNSLTLSVVKTSIVRNKISYRLLN